MVVSVLLSGTLKDGMVDQFTQMCSDSLDSTRKSDGCQNINLTYHTKEQNKFVAKFGSLNSEKAKSAKSQRINKEILANVTNN